VLDSAHWAYDSAHGLGSAFAKANEGRQWSLGMKVLKLGVDSELPTNIVGYTLKVEDSVERLGTK